MNNRARTTASKSTATSNDSVTFGAKDTLASKLLRGQIVENESESNEIGGKEAGLVSREEEELEKESVQEALPTSNEDAKSSSRTSSVKEESAVIAEATRSTPQKKPASPVSNQTPRIYPSLEKFQSQEQVNEDGNEEMENQDEEMKESEGEIYQSEVDEEENLPRQMVGSFPEKDCEESYSFISHPNSNNPSAVPIRSSSLEEFGVGEGSKLSKSKSNSSIGSLASLSSLTSSLKKKAGKIFGGTMSRKRGIEQVEKEDEIIDSSPEKGSNSIMLLDGLPLQPDSPNATKSARERLNQDAPDSPQPIRIIRPRPSRVVGPRESTSSISISPAKAVSAMVPSPLKYPMPSYSIPSSATAAVLAEMNKRLQASGHSTSNLTASTSGLVWNKTQAPRLQLPFSSQSLARFNKSHEKHFDKMEGIDQHYAAKRNVSNSDSIKPETKRIKTDSKPVVSSQEILEIERRKRERALNAARRKAGNPAAIKLASEKAKAKDRTGMTTASSSTAAVPEAKKRAGLSRFTNAVKNVFDFTSQPSTAPSTASKTSISTSSASLSSKPSSSLSSKTSASSSSKTSASLSSKASISSSLKPSSISSSRSTASIGPNSRTTSSSSTLSSTQKEKPKFDLQASLKKTPTYKTYSAKEALEGLRAENTRLASNARPTFNKSPTKIPSPIKVNANSISSRSTLKFPTGPSNQPESSTSSKGQVPKVLSSAARRPRIDGNRLVNKKREAQALALAQSQTKVQGEREETEADNNKTSTSKAQIMSPNTFSTLTSPTSGNHPRSSMPASRLKSGKVRSSISASAHKGARKSVASGVRKNRPVLE